MSKNTNTNTNTEVYDDEFENVEVVETEEDTAPASPINILDIRSWGTNDFPGALMFHYNNGDEKAILEIGRKILLLKKLIGEAATHYDRMFDNRSAFTTKEQKFTNVVRLRKPKVGGGRPKKEKADNLLADLLK